MVWGFVVRPERLELPAYWFEASRSIQLSYGRTSVGHRRRCLRYDLSSYASITTGLTSSPIPSTCTRTWSPAFNHRGGVRAKPTPAGVPVEMMSPGSSVKTLERYAISFRIRKILQEYSGRGINCR